MITIHYQNPHASNDSDTNQSDDTTSSDEDVDHKFYIFPTYSCIRSHTSPPLPYNYTSL